MYNIFYKLLKLIFIKKRGVYVYHSGLSGIHNNIFNILQGSIKLFLMLKLLSCGVAITLSPTSSMTPNLLAGDVFISHSAGRVNLFTYTGIEKLNSLGKKLIQPLVSDQLQPGDAVAFQVSTSSMALAKRICAVGGQKFQIQSGVFFIDGKPLPMKYVGQYFRRHNHKSLYGDLYEVINGNVKYNILYRYGLGGHSTVDHVAEQTVPQNMLVLQGDNFHQSGDFRSLFHYVSQDQIIGKVIGVLTHTSKISSNLIDIITHIDWSRLLILYQFKQSI